MNELVEKAKNGDKDAYAELIQNVKLSMYKVAITRFNNRDDIYDAISEAICIAFEKIKNLKSNEKFKKWILTILINECNRIYKKEKREADSIYKMSMIENCLSYEDAYNEVESNESFAYYMKSLNPDEKTVITLYCGEGYNTTEIAEILGVSKNTVKSRLLRGKEKIRKVMKGDVDYDK